MPEKFPPTPPKRKPLEEEPAHVVYARQQEEARIAAELAADRIAAGVGPDVVVDLSPEEIVELEKEREQLREDTAQAKRVAQKEARRPIAQDGLTQKDGPTLSTKPRSAREFAQARLQQSRETGTLDPVAVQQRLDEKTAAMTAKERELADATERDRIAQEQRELDLQKIREEVGAVQREQHEIRQQAVGASLAERVSALKASSAVNRQIESTDESEYRAAWIKQATPLMHTVAKFLDELEPWAASVLPTLRELSKMTYLDAPAAWAVQYRVQLEDRAKGPSRELIDSIQSYQKGCNEVLAMADAVIGGAMKPTDALLARLANCSKYSLPSLKQRLAVLDTELARVEVRGRQSVRADQRIPTVIINHSRTPVVPRELPGSIDVRYDVHGESK
jgi:hypothetical protein